MRSRKERSYYLVFSTIHDVLKAEKGLKQSGLRFELMPIPRNLSSDCGSCIKLYDELEGAMKYLGTAKVQKCYLHDGKDFFLMIF